MPEQADYKENPVKLFDEPGSPLQDEAEKWRWGEEGTGKQDEFFLKQHAEEVDQE